MRWVCLTLMIINLVLLGWRFGVGLPAKYQAQTQPPAWQAPAGVKRVLLLGEDESAAAPVNASLEDVCRWVGPFTSQQSAQVFIDRVAALDVLSALETENLASGESFWVFLPRESSRAAAQRTLTQLQSRNIESYIIPDGELENAISLGVFRKLSSAQARLEQMVAQGYEPLLESVARDSKQYWVSVAEREFQKVDQNAWNRITKEQFKLQERQKFCLDVASR